MCNTGVKKIVIEKKNSKQKLYSIPKKLCNSDIKGNQL